MKYIQLENFLQRWFLIIPVVFFVPMVLLHFVLLLLRDSTWFIMHTFWPLSVFHLKLPIWQDVLTIGAIVLLGIGGIKLLKTKRYFLVKLLLLLAGLTIATNLLQGFDYGLVDSVSDKSEFAVDYWSESLRVGGVKKYLRNYSLFQHTMGAHSRSHPPGAVLWYYLTRSVVDEPIFVGFMMMMVTLMSIGVVYYWSKKFTSEATARFVGLAFGLMPAMQIYGYASLNGLIMTTTLTSIWLFSMKKTGVVWVSLIISLLISFGLSFESIWLFPVMFVMALKKYATWSELLYTLGVLLLIGLGISKLTGYSYVEGFLIGKSYEGFRGGWYGLVQPASYIVTRIQDVLEPLFFYGPYFSLLTFLSLKEFGFKQVLTGTSLAGIISLCLFLIAGGYYTAETARGTIYLLPLLILGAVPLIEKANFSSNLKYKLLVATLVQTTLMQLFGYFYW